MGRLGEIAARLGKTRVFADVGCDHGYCAKYVLGAGLCELAYVTDISEKSLEKAKALLKEEIAEGRCIPVVCDGLDGVPHADLVLIAGIGGEEIVKILSRRPLPPRFVLQPMKNAEKVRAHLVERGACIEEDVTFGDGKYYDLIAGRGTGGCVYSDFELRYGRDNLRRPSAAFLDKLRHDAANYRLALAATGFSGERREEVRAKLYEIEVITDAIEGDI